MSYKAKRTKSAGARGPGRMLRIRENSIGISLHSGSKIIARKGSDEGERISFDQRQTIFSALLSLLPSSLSRPVRFYLYEEQYLLGSIAVLDYIELEESHITIAGNLYGNDVLEKTEHHPLRFFRDFKRALPIEFKSAIKSSPPYLDESHMLFSRRIKWTKSIRSHVNDFREQTRRYLTITEDRITGLEWRPEWTTDEESFTREMVMPLLRRKGFTSVRYNHGSEENGIDVVCKDVDRLGQEEWIGVQVKRGDISGGAAAKLGALLDQIKAGLSSPYFDPASGENKRIATFYVMCSGRIQESAKTKLRTQLPPALVGAVRFLGKDDLESLVTISRTGPKTKF